jgi:hypothetical protein
MRPVDVLAPFFVSPLPETTQGWNVLARRMKTLAGILVLVSSVSATAASDRLTTYGGADCAVWVSASGSKREDLKQWLAGYVSGLNSFFYRTDPLRRLNSVEQIFVWSDEYCRANPLDTMGDAAFSLLKELDQRTK